MLGIHKYDFRLEVKLGVKPPALVPERNGRKEVGTALANRLEVSSGRAGMS